MRYNFSQEFVPSQEQDSRYLGIRTANCIRAVAQDLLHALRSGWHRSDLLALHDSLSNHIDSLWLHASEGQIKVQSIAMLRVLRTVMCADIGAGLRQPIVYRERLERDLQQVINTLNHFVIPFY
jgi:hypothetical protein